MASGLRVACRPFDAKMLASRGLILPRDAAEETPLKIVEVHLMNCRNGDAVEITGKERRFRLEKQGRKPCGIAVCMSLLADSMTRKHTGVL